MNFSLFLKSESKSVIDFFRTVFSASEGKAEGQIIADFVSRLITTTEPSDMIGCIAKEEKTIVGCVFFSRFFVPDGQVSFILSPMAVLTDVQGKGIGQELIQYGLDNLRTLNVNLVFTYGDPHFYKKTGFEQIREDIVRAPYQLSQPVGWLAQSLDGNEIHAMAGPTQCVAALNDPSLW